MKSSSSWIIAAACSLVLVACGRSIGEPFNVSAADTLIPSVSTMDDAVAKLGPTTHKVGAARGTVVHWHYLRDKPGSTPEVSTVTIMFGRDGRMVEILQRFEERPAAQE